MRVFKFDARISADGIIQIPHTPSLLEQEVELIIVPKPRKRAKVNSGKSFIKKWAGFLTDEDADSCKNDYLSKKYK